MYSSLSGTVKFTGCEIRRYRRCGAQVTGDQVIATGGFSGLGLWPNVAGGAHLQRPLPAAMVASARRLTQPLMRATQVGVSWRLDNTFTIEGTGATLRSSRLYVNLHTEGKSGGELRAGAADELAYFTTLAGLNEVQPAAHYGYGRYQAGTSGDCSLFRRFPGSRATLTPASPAAPTCTWALPEQMAGSTCFWQPMW